MSAWDDPAAHIRAVETERDRLREVVAEIVPTIEAMQMVGVGSGEPAARFGYDRARGQILNYLRAALGSQP